MKKNDKDVKNKIFGGGVVSFSIFLLVVIVIIFRENVTTLANELQPDLKNKAGKILPDALKAEATDLIRTLNGQKQKERIDNLYNKFDRVEEITMNHFIQRINDNWGDYVGPSRFDWVEYNKDLTERSRINFENGTGRVELLLNKSEIKNKERIRQRIYTAFINLFKSRGKSTITDAFIDENFQVSDQTFLKDQVALNNGELVTYANLDQFIREIIRKNSMKPEKIINARGHEKYKVKLDFPLSRDYMKVRKQSVAEIIKDCAQRYRIDPDLLNAIIYTESHFNPLARSHVPAYGLMQLVPKSAGREAHQLIYGQDGLVTPADLYNPQQNIEYGSAYLSLLKNKYFNDVKDSLSQTYCMIAAYNTGPSNVSTVFNSTHDLKYAVKKINMLSPSRVYESLLYRLPYKETRRYLADVTERITLYKNERRLRNQNEARSVTAN